ncbi:hypothetical protein ABZ471_37190 [Streptomyces sp. NPDC005728]|uniref:hypothetical protein n=1 Tax=Streptomyces sp. NPDC005728 TaxID=3157054 RepID=UPI003405F714
MSINQLAQPQVTATSARFLLIGYLPTYGAALYLLTLVWADTPEGRPHWAAAWKTAEQLTAGELVLLAVTITIVAVLLQPLQLALVRLLEGQWPQPLRPLADAGRARQTRARDKLRLIERRAEDAATDPGPQDVQAAGAAGARLRRRFPASGPVRATALGNALAAAEERAGAVYGWDAVVAWPRLHPLLSDQVRAVVNDRRDLLDATARLSVTSAATALVSIALVARSGPWLLLVLAPFVVSRIAYHGAVHAAQAFGDSLDTAFDLHRFDLLEALHLPLPDTPAGERALAAELSLMWRQGVPSDRPYRHGSA